MSNRRKLRPTLPTSMLIRSIDGARIRGGCDHCNAYTSVTAVVNVSAATAHRLKEELTASGEAVLPDATKGLDGRKQPARRPTVVAAKNDREAERAQQALAVIGDELPSVPVMDGRIHPAAVEARQLQITLARLAAALRLPAGDEDETPKHLRRPQRRVGARGVYSVRAS